MKYSGNQDNAGIIKVDVKESDSMYGFDERKMRGIDALRQNNPKKEVHKH